MLIFLSYIYNVTFQRFIGFGIVFDLSMAINYSSLNIND
ncbi:hypothetical protein M2459_001285 [Parabacteroides sp. PF5-5]|nr:hypothetical protein [Parabacteroides sp. PH5-39]MDH6315296.1 hypothetical protein [Parabacteroides sp. PF5-13]MDH6319210.1 hypothetical protein [Parabacteroides sp. PH5-13]MDH6322941.1 hypothetical protein [Parabacteroides sp. PH5-8]MDH6326487.1 hypothetical protein [Parabacteroides sp. PH5-41]MDH6334543.1 hypothetical protein [Parabacteroides sp. PF5-5]MDH6345352.1 hypothetical protein [Parabacteroides sp. PH5-46]MDH6360308.1 hypothetical protein [Parabacteroides sp. PH5-16]MDH6376230.